MNIAITGITGFLGGYVAKRLFEREVYINALVRSTSNTLRLKEYQKRITYTQGNLDNKETLKKFVQGANVVIHMAYEREGASFHDAANKDIKRFIESNLLGSIELLDASVQAGVQQFIFVSSCAVYGHVFPDRKLDELHPLMPDSKYGAYKASVEAFCSAYYLSDGLMVTILRPVGIYGIDPHLAHSSWYNIVKDIKQGKSVEVSGGGKVVSVEDVAHAIDLALGNKDASGKIYNLVDTYIDNFNIARIAKNIIGSSSYISGTSKEPLNRMENIQSKKLGLSYAGIDGIKHYIHELAGRI
ncbi:MAG: NAD(P)-dependent oxidoreductase [Candidatus Brocadiaceae bacterium]|nr:NAD(P)-dependent oxidoreductase [Candidatus Brocadiaceae bacterium]